MPEARRDLWPSNFTTTTLLPPVAILREQADLLGKKTRGLVTGEVTSSATGSYIHNPDVLVQYPPPPGLHHTLRIRVPALDNYRYELLAVTHGVEFYPLTVTFLPTRQEYAADSEEDYTGILQQLFAREETVNILRSLVAQVQR
jgi:hypothetical protein